MQPTTGSIVISRAGRDKGMLFAVVLVEKDFCYIADGKNRTIDKPKHKKQKHLQMTNTVLPQESLSTNKQLRKALAMFMINEPSQLQ